MKHVNELMEAHNWLPIRGCPGRYILGEPRPLTLQDLIADAPFQRITTAAAVDPILVVRLEGGGLISYEKQGGAYIHTLGDENGFRRKLAQLGID